jgi:hypothetical protein
LESRLTNRRAVGQPSGLRILAVRFASNTAPRSPVTARAARKSDGCRSCDPGRPAGTMRGASCATKKGVGKRSDPIRTARSRRADSRSQDGIPGGETIRPAIAEHLLVPSRELGPRFITTHRKGFPVPVAALSATSAAGDCSVAEALPRPYQRTTQSPNVIPVIDDQ